MPADRPETTDDGCCGGGVGPVPYPGCTDCPRIPQRTTKAINWRRVKRDAKKAQKVRMREFQECIAHARRQS